MRKGSESRFYALIAKVQARDNGSATLEFLIFALPLFLPLILFITQASQKSQIEFDANNFARQLVRAYVTSPSSELAPLRLYKVQQIFESSVLKSHGVSVPAQYLLNCSADPCLTPGARVEITVSLTSSTKSDVFSARAVEYVDEWRSS